MRYFSRLKLLKTNTTLAYTEVLVENTYRFSMIALFLDHEFALETGAEYNALLVFFCIHLLINFILGTIPFMIIAKGMNNFGHLPRVKCYLHALAFFILSFFHLEELGGTIYCGLLDKA